MSSMTWRSHGFVFLLRLFLQDGGFAASSLVNIDRLDDLPDLACQLLLIGLLNRALGRFLWPGFRDILVPELPDWGGLSRLG